jgi:uncharacterized phiE125 gp8 family phage protein
VSEAKAHLRVDQALDDAAIAVMTAAAREWVEAAAGRALIAQSWRATLDAWPAGPALTLIRPPVQAVIAVRTFSADGTAALWPAGNYALSQGAEPTKLLRLAAAWPEPGRAEAGIEIDLTCGYGAAGADVPAALRQAVLIVLAALYEGRASLPPQAEFERAQALIAPFRVRGL